MTHRKLRATSQNSRTLRQSLAALALAACFITTANAQQPQPWKQIPTPPLHAFKPTEPTHFELPNGVTVFLQEDHELPFISGFIRIRGGSRDEPAAKVGLVSIYGEVWRTSGTAKASGDALDDTLAAKAASIETGGGGAATSISWSSFATDFDSVFGSSLDLLLHPTFQQAKLDLAKSSAVSGILRRNDDAASIAGREAVEIAYGKTNPYGREAEIPTITAITLPDLTAWHDRTVVGSNLIVGVIGDFDSKVMEQKLRSAFEPIPKGTKLVTAKIDFTEPTPGIYFANKSDVDQSNIYMVGLGTQEDNPDFYALSVMNEVFSGGFGSRVVQNVRTKLGLAYDVGGSFGAAYDHPGLFVVDAGTKSASTVPASKAVLDELARLRTDPPTEAELRRAKDDLLNSFIFRYDSPSKVLSEQVTLAVYNYPADFLERYRTGVEKVTAADVARVAQKYVQPEKLAIVVVGNNSEIIPPLSGLGKVTTLDIAIPGAPKQRYPAADHAAHRDHRVCLYSRSTAERESVRHSKPRLNRHSPTHRKLLNLASQDTVSPPVRSRSTPCPTPTETVRTTAPTQASASRPASPRCSKAASSWTSWTSTRPSSPSRPAQSLSWPSSASQQ